MLLQMAKFNSFLWLSSIPLYIYTTSSFSIHLLIETGCCHILVIVNNATVNTGVRVYFQISVFVFFQYTERSGTARWYGSSIFSFLMNLSILFSTVAAPIYVPTHSAQVFPFVYILTNICYLLSF